MSKRSMRNFLSVKRKVFTKVSILNLIKKFP